MKIHNYVEKRYGVRTEIVFDCHGSIRCLLVRTENTGYHLSAFKHDTYGRMPHWEIESTDRIGLVPGDELLKYVPDELEHQVCERGPSRIPLRAIVTDVLDASRGWVAALGLIS